MTVHAYQNMAGDFKRPEGVGEEESLFPPANNLAEKGRPFVGSGDGMMLVGDQLTIDGKAAPQASSGRGPGPGPGGRAGVPGGMPGGPGGRGPGRGGPGGAMGNRAAHIPYNGAIFVGSKGYMATTSRGEGVWLLPASRWAEYKLPPQILPRGINHQQDWVRACKGGTPGVSEFGVATKYIEWLILGAVALRVPGKLMWDSKNMRFTNSVEANKYLKPYVRKGWEMKL